MLNPGLKYATSLPLPTGAATEETLQKIAGSDWNNAPFTRDGNGILTAITFKMDTTTVKTLTFTRNANNQIIEIIKS